MRTLFLAAIAALAFADHGRREVMQKDAAGKSREVPGSGRRASDTRTCQDRQGRPVQGCEGPFHQMLCRRTGYVMVSTTSSPKGPALSTNSHGGTLQATPATAAPPPPPTARRANPAGRPASPWTRSATNPDLPGAHRYAARVTCMCNLYGMTRARSRGRRPDPRDDRPEQQSAAAARASFPDYAAPIVVNGEGGREMRDARWGLPSPAFALQGKSVDRGIHKRPQQQKSPHWRRWLAPEFRCLVPFTSFAEPADRQSIGERVVCARRGSAGRMVRRHMGSRLAIRSQGQGRRSHHRAVWVPDD